VAGTKINLGGHRANNVHQAKSTLQVVQTLRAATKTALQEHLARTVRFVKIARKESRAIKAKACAPHAQVVESSPTPLHSFARFVLLDFINRSTIWILALCVQHVLQVSTLKTTAMIKRATIPLTTAKHVQKGITLMVQTLRGVTFVKLVCIKTKVTRSEFRALLAWAGTLWTTVGMQANTTLLTIASFVWLGRNSFQPPLRVEFAAQASIRTRAATWLVFCVPHVWVVI
jgi:hypothetical protein